MQTYQVIVTVTERGDLVIPAPLNKAGARLKLVVTWEEETRPETRDVSRRAEAIRKLRGSLKDTNFMGVGEWNRHKHEIWERR